MRASDTDGVCLYFHLPPWEKPHEKVPQWPVPGRLVLVSLVEGELTSVVRSRELQDEKEQIFPTYSPGIRPLPVSSHVIFGLHLLTFRAV